MSGQSENQKIKKTQSAQIKNRIVEKEWNSDQDS